MKNFGNINTNYYASMNCLFCVNVIGKHKAVKKFKIGNHPEDTDSEVGKII